MFLYTYNVGVCVKKTPDSMHHTASIRKRQIKKEQQRAREEKRKRNEEEVRGYREKAGKIIKP